MSKSVKIFGSFLFIAVIIIGGALAYQFLRYRNTGLDGLQKVPEAVVSITSPQPYSEVLQGAAIAVNVSAHGYQPLVSIELWINGKLMGVQAAPPGGQLMFDTTFAWFPSAAGEFSLAARIVDANGDMTVSTPVTVNILSYVPVPGADNGGGLDAGSAMVLPAAPMGGGIGGSNDGGLPSAGDSVGVAQTGALSPVDWVTNLVNNKLPKTPTLTVAVNGCTATLSIHDLSINEEGFQIFRSTDYSPAWTQIATLNSQSVLDWITYQDTLKGTSQASYYVAAVNGAGQAKSNLVTAGFSTTDCPAAESNQQVLSVEPLSFTSDLAVDQAYCYKSMNNAGWERWPQTGFFEPGPGGFDIQKYKLAVAVNGLDGQPILKTLDLRLECWGWAAGALKYLGEVHFTNDVSTLREQDEQHAGDISIKLKFGIGKPNSPKIPQPDPNPPFVLSQELPKIFLMVTYNPEDCQVHLPPNAQNVLGAFIFCSPFPAYTLGQGTANPQPYLMWFVSTKFCPAGEDAACMFLSQLQSIAQDNNGSVEFVIDSSASNSDDSVPVAKTSYVVPPQNCVGQRQFTVRIAYGDENTTVWSQPSNTVNVPCYVGNQVGLNVSFNTLTLSNVGDGIGGGGNLELYGVLSAASSDGSMDASVMQYYPSTGCETDAIGFLPSPGLPVPPVVLNSNGTLGCNRKSDGIFSFASDLTLCPSTDFFNCSSDFPADFNRNTPHVTAGNGDHLLLTVLLMDYDSGNGDDPVCIAMLNTESKSVQDWANTSGEVFNLSQGDNDNAACNVQVTISAGNAVQGLGKYQIP